MYSIGDLARLGGVTRRMLRHYDELGVLVPDEVDADTGYRRYGPAQLADLFRVLALKDLGFALTDVGRIVRSELGPSELRGMLLLRRTEIESELDEATTRLGRVEQQIERLERQMNQPPTSTIPVETKALPRLRLAVASAVSPSFASADIGPTIQPLYPRLFEALEGAGVAPVGPSVAYYESYDDGVGVHAGFPVDDSVTDVEGLDIVELPEVELAVTAVHVGDMASVDAVTVPVLFDWMRDHGFTWTGTSREIYLHWAEEPGERRTEMQFPIERC